VLLLLDPGFHLPRMRFELRCFITCHRPIIPLSSERRTNQSDLQFRREDMSASSDAATFLHRSEFPYRNPERVNADGIWRIAEALVKHQGSSAPMIAATQARKLLESGEIEERLTWMRVMAASKALLGKGSI
jgi:hypothetical protein